MQKNEEVWKDVVGYDGLYQVSSFGRVKNSYQRVLTQTIKKGYYTTALSKDKKQKQYQTHRLVAIAFIENSDKEKIEVNHMDENKLNNHASNLEWCTHIYNMNYGKALPADRKTRKILQLKNDKIVGRYNSIYEAGQELDTCCGNISKCLRGKLKTCCGYKWKYAE